MTPNQPISAYPCQTLENPIYVELSPSKENGADTQVIEGESGAWQPVSLSAEVGGWHIQFCVSSAPQRNIRTGIWQVRTMERGCLPSKDVREEPGDAAWVQAATRTRPLQSCWPPHQGGRLAQAAFPLQNVG
jgi:hypothetical protein